MISVKKDIKVCIVNHSLVLQEFGYSAFNLNSNFSKFLYLFNFDNDFGYISDSFTNIKGENLLIKKIKSSEFLVYQGHHGGPLASASDLVIPSFLNVETNGYFLNFLGKAFLSLKLQQSFTLAKSNFSIFEIITFLFKDSFFKGSLNSSFSLTFLKNAFYSKSFLKNRKHFYFLDKITVYKNSFFDINSSSLTNFYFPKYSKKPFFFIVEGFVKPCVLDFYRTDIVSRNSRIMVTCSLKFKNTSNFRKNLC